MNGFVANFAFGLFKLQTSNLNTKPPRPTTR
ncbi:MAG: hypothetical protein RIR31_462, partial [Bacteroidota bacterium]